MPSPQHGELLAEHKVFQEKIPTAAKGAKDRAKPEQKRLTMGQSHNKLCSEPVPYVADSSARKHFVEAQRLLYFFSSQGLESKMAKVHGA